MPRLLCAEEVARTTNFKVTHGNFKARAELGELTDSRQALFGDLAQNLVLPEGEVRRRPSGRAADTATDLVQLRKPHLVGILDDEGVDIGDIDARFDYRRANQYLHLAVGDLLHNRGEHILIHLPVGYTDGDLAAEHVTNFHGRALDVIDAVVQVIHLSATLKLTVNGIAQHRPIVLHDEGLHRQSVLRRLIDGRHVTDAGKRHVERSGYRRCRERQNIDTSRHFLNVLLVAHAEALLLIDN